MLIETLLIIGGIVGIGTMFHLLVCWRDMEGPPDDGFQHERADHYED